MIREDGSEFDENQLRHKGKFINERVRLNLSDYGFLGDSGYTREEAKRACAALNIELQERIDSGEIESGLSLELRGGYFPF
jgi:hypothetical protein